MGGAAPMGERCRRRGPGAPPPPGPPPGPPPQREEDLRLRQSVAAVRDLMAAAQDLHAVGPADLATLLDVLLRADAPRA